MAYDLADQQTEILLQAAGPAAVSFDYKYDAVGYKTRFVEANGDRVTGPYGAVLHAMVYLSWIANSFI